VVSRIIWYTLHPPPHPPPTPKPCSNHHTQQKTAQIRGTLGSLNQLVICIGILAALLTNVVIDSSQWRSMFYLAALPALLLAAGRKPGNPIIPSPKELAWLP